MLTRAEFSMLLSATSVSATWREAKSPNRTANLRVILAPIDKSDEVLVNAYGIGGHTIQFLADALPVAPVKFDSIAAGGKTHIFDTVIEQHERGNGTLVYYICHSKT